MSINGGRESAHCCSENNFYVAFVVRVLENFLRIEFLIAISLKMYFDMALEYFLNLFDRLGGGLLVSLFKHASVVACIRVFANCVIFIRISV